MQTPVPPAKPADGPVKIAVAVILVGVMFAMYAWLDSSKSASTSPSRIDADVSAPSRERRVLYASAYETEVNKSGTPGFSITAQGSNAEDLVIKHAKMSTALANASFYDAQLRATWLNEGFKRVVFMNNQGAADVRELK